MRDHKITDFRCSPTHVIVRCACGWSKEISRRQNALGRASKVRAAINQHLTESTKHLSDAEDDYADRAEWKHRV